jgi:hypothetical protein
LLLTGQARLEVDGDPALADEMRQLHRELFIEFKATRLAQALGGIALSTGQLAWFGPLWMDQYGWQEAVSQYTTTMVPDDSLTNQLLGKLSPDDALRRLRWYFSYLRTAAILLEGSEPDPKGALQALDPSSGKQTPDCRMANCPVHGKHPFPVLVCCLHSEQFAPNNPAYAGLSLPEAEAQMCDDA